MLKFLVGVLSLALTFTLPTSTFAGPKQREVRKAYTGDARAEKSVTVTPGRAKVRSILTLLGRDTGMDLRVQDDRESVTCTLAVRSRPAGEIMDSLSALLRMEWYRVGETYVLAEDRDLAQYCMLPEEVRRERWDGAGSFVLNSLTEAQKARIMAGESLGVQDFTPAQRTAALEVGRYWRLLDPETVGADALRLRGYAIRLTDDRTAIGFFVPDLGGSPTEAPVEKSLQR